MSLELEHRNDALQTMLDAARRDIATLVAERDALREECTLHTEALTVEVDAHAKTKAAHDSQQRVAISALDELDTVTSERDALRERVNP